MSLPITAADLLQRFEHPSLQAIALLGRHARGDVGPFSAIDLLRLLASDAPELLDGALQPEDRPIIALTVARIREAPGEG